MIPDLVFIIFTFVVVQYIIKRVDLERQANSQRLPALPDIFHDLTNERYWAQTVFVYTVDALLLLVIGFSSVDVLEMYGLKTWIYMGYRCAILHWIRCLAVYCTHIPSPNCTNRTFISRHRHDLVISGHAMTAAYCCSHVFTTNLAVLMWAATLIMSGLSIFSREHYTSDIIIGLALGSAF